MTQPIVRRRLFWLIAASAVAFARVARAQLSAPAVPIKALDDALLQIMRAGTKAPFAERARIAAPAIEAAFDLPQILKTSVGARWTTLAIPQQLELTEVFRRYTVASYVANFDSYSGERFDIAQQIRVVGGDQVVTTHIVPTSGDPTRIDYVMRPGGGGWKGVDVLLDGTISQVAVRRSDFRALLDKGGAAALTASLRAKTAGLEAGGNQ